MSEEHYPGNVVLLIVIVLYMVRIASSIRFINKYNIQQEIVVRSQVLKAIFKFTVSRTYARVHIIADRSEIMFRIWRIL